MLYIKQKAKSDEMNNKKMEEERRAFEAEKLHLESANEKEKGKNREKTWAS